MVYNKLVEIIENDTENINKFHKRGWVSDSYEITREQIEELLNGKAIGLDDGETTTIITLRVE